jgi:hypothetical protein
MIEMRHITRGFDDRIFVLQWLMFVNLTALSLCERNCPV